MESARGVSVQARGAADQGGPAGAVSLEAYAESEGENTHSGNTVWQTKLTLAPTLIAADYCIQWYMELYNSQSNRTTEAQLLIDAVPPADYGTLSTRFALPDVQGGFCGLKKLTLDAGVHTFVLQYRINDAVTGCTAKCRRARLLLWRV